MSYVSAMRATQRSPIKSFLHMVWAHFIWWGVFRFVLLWMMGLGLLVKVASWRRSRRTAA